MTKTFTRLSLTLTAGFASLLLIAYPVSASGLTTGQSNQPGQVIVNQDGETVYLTTETNPGATTSGDTYFFGRTVSLINSRIILPTGFASDFGKLINSLLSAIMVISVLLVFLFLVWAAFDWITSGGDKGKTDKARQKMIAAVIGLIVVSASFAILNLVIRFLGFRDINEVLRSPRSITGPPSTATPSAERSFGEIINATPSASPTN